MGDHDTPLEFAEDDPLHYSKWPTEKWVQFWESMVDNHAEHRVRKGDTEVGLVWWLKMNIGFVYDRMLDNEEE